MDAQEEVVEEKSTNNQKIIILSLIFGLFVFTLTLASKLPETKIQNLIISHLKILAQQHGLSFNTEKIKIGVLLGPSISFQNIEIKSLDEESQSVKISSIKIKPKFLALFSPIKQVDITSELLDGTISGMVGFSPNDILLDLDLEKLDTSKMSLYKKFIPLEFSAKLDGKVDLELHWNKMENTAGKVLINLKQLNSPAQTVSNISIPKLSISEAKIDLFTSKGQLNIRGIDIGKDLKTDDLVAKITGDGTLSKQITSSKINGKALFQFSSKVLENFPFIEGLMSNAKTPDGKFAYKFSGTIDGIDASPGN